VVGAVSLLVNVARRQPVPAPHQHVSRETSAPLDLNGALETVLVKAMDSQTSMFERMQRLNVENAELALNGLQRRKYQRGGNKRAATAGRLKGRFLRDCRLCVDPMIGDPTVAEIIEHSTHRSPRAAPKNVAVEDKGNRFEAHVDERTVQMGFDGIEQVECEDCGKPGHVH
jgi:hypothetical protein